MTDESGARTGGEPLARVATASVRDVVRAIRDSRTDGGHGSYAFLVGPGASRPAGVPTPGDLIEDWRRRRYAEDHRSFDVDEADPAEIRAWAQEVETEVDVADRDRFGFWFEQVHTTRGERRRFIRSTIADAAPTLGTISLASLMAEGYVEIALTPNYDDLLAAAFWRFLDVQPTIVPPDASPEEFRFPRDRPAILKLHGDYRYDDLRSGGVDSERLVRNVRQAVSMAVGDHGLVVVGYRGTDRSIVDDVLSSDVVDVPELGIYWCARDADSLSDGALDLLRADNTYLVPIEGAESFLTTIANRVPDVDPPTSEALSEQAEKRKAAIQRALVRAADGAETGEVAGYVDALRYVSTAHDFLAGGDWSRAVELSTKAINARAEDGPAVAYNIRGAARTAMGEPLRAIEEFSAAIDLDPSYAAAHDNRGVAHTRLEEYRAAIEAFDRAIELDPDRATAYANRAKAHLESGHTEAAIEDYTRTIELDPGDAAAYNDRGSAHQRQGEHDAAIDDFTRAIELDPAYAEAYNHRGTAHSQRADYVDAIGDFTNAIELDPESAGAFNNRGNAYCELEEYEAAIEDYTAAIEIEPDDPVTYYNRGTAHKHLGEYAAAVEDQTRAIELDPAYAAAYNNRGIAHKHLDEVEAAIEDYTTAIELEPGYASAYNNRGIAYGLLGEYEQAIADYSKAIELDDDFVSAYLNRAEARILAGDIAGALEDAESAYFRAGGTARKAESLMLTLAGRILTGEDIGEKVDEYRKLCSQTFTTSWSFEELENWLGSADLPAEKTGRIEEFVGLLREHKATAT